MIAYKKINLISLFLLSLLTLSFSLSITILSPESESYVNTKDFIVSFELKNVNTYANCSIQRANYGLTGKGYLTEGVHTLFISSDGTTFPDGYHNLTISCKDLTQYKKSSININKSTPNTDITFYDILMFTSFILTFISILLFFPLGFLKLFKIDNPIYYGMISICVMVIISLGLNNFNWFFTNQPYLYYLSLFLGFGNVLYSIPHYIHNKLEDIKNTKVYGKDYKERFKSRSRRGK